MSLFVNRTLNLKNIKAIGFDMDHTIVRYNVEAFEHFTYKEIVKKLIEVKAYPKSLESLKFDYQKSIQGLVIDKKHGNILKLNRYGKVKEAYHGSHKIGFNSLKDIYQGRVIDLTDFNVQSLDTNFSISNGVLFGQLIDLKEADEALPSFETISDDLREMLDLCHRDGTIKDEVIKHKEKYLIKDPQVVSLMQKLKSSGKKIMVITNSDIHYTKALLDYTFNPYLQNESWDQLFHLVITFARKPKFFNEKNNFLSIDLKSMKKSPHSAVVSHGVYEGGNAHKLEEDLGLSGEDFLYFGDHIYGDVVALKKNLNWRTALVLDPLVSELEALGATKELQNEIDNLMEQKINFENLLDEIYKDNKSDHDQKSKYKDLIAKIDKKLSPLIKKYQKHFNPYWGELMRSGSEESRFADQIEKYACIYMTKISELEKFSSRYYFRPKKRALPHEMVD